MSRKRQWWWLIFHSCIFAVEVPSLVISSDAIDTSSSLSTTSTENISKRKNSHYYFIIEGTIPPYFTCLQQQQQPPPKQSADCSIPLIHHQQHRILTLLQQQPQQQQAHQNITSIQRIDSSCQITNSIYIRITITVSPIGTMNDDHHHDRHDALLLALKEQYQPNIPDIRQIYLSSSLSPSSFVSQQQSTVNDDHSTQPRQRNTRRQRARRHLEQRGTTTTSATTPQPPPPLLPPLKSVGADQAHAMMIRSHFCGGPDQNLTGMGITIAVLDGGIDYTHSAMNGIGTRAAFQQAFGISVNDVRNTIVRSPPPNMHYSANWTRPYFPTDTIIGGYDTLGDLYNNNNMNDDDGSSSMNARPDPNPIDLNGHGTAVTHVIRTIAPAAQFLAVKVCSTSTHPNHDIICPDFAILRGIEYILDRNQDDIIDDDLVQVINISIGRMYISSYYNILSKVIETLTTKYNIVVVISSGNYGNVPFILGDVPGTPNAITVGATTTMTPDVDLYNNYDESRHYTVRRTMASYSSRGPAVSVQNQIKPDIVAPGGPYSLAYASTGNQYRTFEGTSFSTPYITGGVALLKQKCPSCSPLSIKSLLMNHAVHSIRSNVPLTEGTSNDEPNAPTTEGWAPVTLQGSGEMQIHNSLLATYWVYCIEDMNPSISLGLVDVASSSSTVQIHRTLRITKLTNTTETLYLKYELRSLIHENALSIHFATPNHNMVLLEGSCQDEYILNVTFAIHTQFAPSNHMYSGGAASTNPNNLDYNEIDGWIILSSKPHNNDTETTQEQVPVDRVADGSEHDVGIPFHMIVRKAANVTFDSSPSTRILNNAIFDNLPLNMTVNVKNHGTEVAQMDSFQLIYISSDQPESEFGINHPPADLRYVGYRTVAVTDHSEDCTKLIEFAIQTWERQQSLSYTHFNIWIDLDFDNIAEHTVFNSAYRLGSTHSEMRRIDLRSNREYCVGYTPDHATNTANTVLRFCSDDIGVRTNKYTDSATIINVAITSYSFPGNEISDIMEYRNITIPSVGLGAPSYDIEPGAVLRNLSLFGSGKIPSTDDATTQSSRPMGLLLFTNSFRSWTSTGSATHDSEALVIVRTDIVPPSELTPDTIHFPLPQHVDGPSCSDWANDIIHNTSSPLLPCTGNRRRLATRPMPNITNWIHNISSIRHGYRRETLISLLSTYRRKQPQFGQRRRARLLQHQPPPDAVCPEYAIPRVSPIRVSA